MNDLFGTGISIEKMAAYLDGNLDTEESSFIEQQIKSIDDLKDFMSLSDSIDVQMNAMASDDSDYLSNILSEDFELPEILGSPENSFLSDMNLDDSISVVQSSFDNESPIAENSNDGGDSNPAIADVQNVDFIDF